MNPTYSTVGNADDVRSTAAALMSARLVLVPHDRMTPAQLAWHQGPGGWCVGNCRGWWRVLCMRGGQPFAQWRAPHEAAGVRLVKMLERAMANGTYPIAPGPSAVRLGSLEMLTDGKGRLELPGRPKRGAKRTTAA